MPTRPKQRSFILLSELPLDELDAAPGVLDIEKGD